MGTKIELRNQKRKKVVEAIILRQEPVHLVRRIHNIPARTVFDWLSLYRSGGWDALKEGARSGRPRKLTADHMKWVYEAVTLRSPLNYQFEFLKQLHKDAGKPILVIAENARYHHSKETQKFIEDKAGEVHIGSLALRPAQRPWETYNP